MPLFNYESPFRDRLDLTQCRFLQRDAELSSSVCGRSWISFQLRLQASTSVPPLTQQCRFPRLENSANELGAISPPCGSDSRRRERQYPAATAAGTSVGNRRLCSKTASDVTSRKLQVFLV